MDFATDARFAHFQLKMREHYGFEIGESTIQRIALGDAHAIFEADRDEVRFPEEGGRHKQIVAQIDGGMTPVMMPDAGQKDKRKGKTLSWQEAKISLAHAKGSRTPVYVGGIEGGLEDAGRRLFACAVRAGFGADSHVHAVGDGAPPAFALTDSHILFHYRSKKPALVHCPEPFAPTAHGNRPGRCVIAVPATEPCHDPGGACQAAGWVWVALPFGLALQDGTESLDRIDLRLRERN